MSPLPKGQLVCGAVVLPAISTVTSMPYKSPYDIVLPSHLGSHQERGEKRAGLSLNVIPCLGIFFSGLSRKVYPGPKSLAESLSVKESKI